MKRKIKRQLDDTKKIDRNPYKKHNNSLIENEKEREYLKAHNCPGCNSGEIYYRVKTKDYRCKICKVIFYYDGNMYVKVTDLCKKDLHRLYVLLNCLLNKNDELKKIQIKLAMMLLAERGKIKWGK